MADAKSIQVANVAEKVIENFKGPEKVFERFRVLYNMNLRPFQWEWFFMMDDHASVLLKSVRRIGKSVAIQMKNLDENLTIPNEEEMVFAPTVDQASNIRKIQNKVINESPVLMAYLKRDTQGKQIFNKREYEFYNNSNSRCFGVRSEFESYNATKQHIDELDDISFDDLKRIRGRAYSKNENGMPNRFRLSGVIWGKLNIFRVEKEGRYKLLPPMDVYMGLAGGWLDRDAVINDRLGKTDSEWLRTDCLIYVEARNFIHEQWLNISQSIGYANKLNLIVPQPGIYQRTPGEKVAIGLDGGAQGSGEDASDYSLSVESMLGPFRKLLFTITWPGTADPETIIKGVTEVWRYFRPDGGYGDALIANLIAQINDRIYEMGYVTRNWRKYGKNDREGWSLWAKKGLLTPLRNEGWTKHYFYTSLQNTLHNAKALAMGKPVANVLIMPKIDHYKADNLEHHKELKILIAELSNLQSEKTSSGYLKITRIVKKIDDPKLRFKGSSKLGDDRSDGLAMSNYFLDSLTKRNTSKDFQAHSIPGV